MVGHWRKIDSGINDANSRASKGVNERNHRLRPIFVHHAPSLKKIRPPTRIGGPLPAERCWRTARLAPRPEANHVGGTPLPGKLAANPGENFVLGARSELSV